MNGPAKTSTTIGGEMKPKTQQREPMNGMHHRQHPGSKTGKEIDRTTVSAGLTCVALATGLRVDLHTSRRVISGTVIAGIPTTKPRHGILQPILGIHGRQNQMLIQGIKQIMALPILLQDAARKPVCILGKVTAREATLVHSCTSSRTKS